MALKDLKRLKEKENRIYLILIIWVLVGYALSQFLIWTISLIIFLPLMYICVTLILITLISKRPINDVDKKRFITGTILGILLIVSIILATYGSLVGKKAGVFPSWLGLFFIWVVIYTVYLLYSIYSGLSSADTPTAYSSLIELMLFFFNLFLLIYTISGLIGTKAMVMKEKAKFIGMVTILLWLIFSIASYEFAKGFPGLNVGVVRNIAVYFLFIPLLLIVGVCGIRQQKKLLKEKELANEVEDNKIIE